MKLKLLLLAILAIFSPLKPAILTVGVLVLSDMVTGIIAAKKRKEQITSAGLRRTLAKLIIFECALLLGYLTEMYLTGNLIPVSKIVAAFIGMVEYKSMLENLNEINGESIFTSLINKLGKDEDENIK
jgi:predicted transcriptional regulator